MDPGYGNLWRRGVGATVTVDQAIALSLTASDNTAHRLLYTLSEGRPSDVYEYLDVHIATVADETAISPRSYATILRSLYFSAYLSATNSNEILELLASANEGDELRGSIPSSVRIAQKIGVKAFDGDKNQFHSRCGIFYVPERPYVLCVMVLGTQNAAATQTREVSEMVYQYVSSR
jgi:hypothetical protein